MLYLPLGGPVILRAALDLGTCAHFVPDVFLARSVGHVHRRITDHLNVVYYVADSFSKEYTGSSLKTVERNVEDDYIANLRNNCWKEKQQSECVGVAGTEPESRRREPCSRGFVGPSAWCCCVPATSQSEAGPHPASLGLGAWGHLEVSSRFP